MKLLLSFIAAITGVPFKNRAFTRDVAFGFRMPGGIAGDINRMHPASVEPCLIDSAAPPTMYGEAVLATADALNAVRPFAAGDAAVDTIWGVTVRPYPASQGGTVVAPGAASAFGSGTPPATGVIDVLRSGYMTVKIPAAEAALAFKGGAVFVRCAAAAADDPIGGFKAQDDAGNATALDVKRYQFNGPADANGNVELCVNV